MYATHRAHIDKWFAFSSSQLIIYLMKSMQMEFIINKIIQENKNKNEI